MECSFQLLLNEQFLIRKHLGCKKQKPSLLAEESFRKRWLVGRMTRAQRTAGVGGGLEHRAETESPAEGHTLEAIKSKCPLLGCDECNLRIFWRLWKRSGAGLRLPACPLYQASGQRRIWLLHWGVKGKHQWKAHSHECYAQTGARVLEGREWNIGWKEGGRYLHVIFIARPCAPPTWKASHVLSWFAASIICLPVYFHPVSTGSL